MEVWQLLVAVLAVVIAASALLYRAWRNTQDDIAWANRDLAGVKKDLAEIRKDVEWLVWHFKRGKEGNGG